MARVVGSLQVVIALAAHARAYKNVMGGTLAKCSEHGMALTGFLRDGHCTERSDDTGSHHICIDLSSTSGGNFCTTTGQSNWCSSSMECDGDASSNCPVEHWCVCQWAFASYIENAGGCDMIQDIVCEATNMVALEAYEAAASSSSSVADALACLRSRCDLDDDGDDSAAPASAEVDTPAAKMASTQEAERRSGEPVSGKSLLISVGLLAFAVLAGFVLGRSCRRHRAAATTKEVSEHTPMEGVAPTLAPRPSAEIQLA